MRILLVSHGYPPFGLTGVERVTEQTALALSTAGHEVTVLSRRPTAAPPLPSLERTRHRGGVEIVMIAGGGAPPGGPFPGFQDRLEQIFERLLLELLPDVVVIGHLTTHSPGYISVAHRWRIPVVMELHDFYAVCERAHLERPTGELCDGPEGGRACARHCFPGQEDALERWALRTHLFRHAVTEADALIAPSEFVADYFRRRHGPGVPIRVIPNGVAFKTSPAPIPPTRNGPLHFASLGPVTQHKGVHLVVEALRKARLSAARYTLFGPVGQPHMRELREAADRVGGLELRSYGPYEPAMLPLLLSDVDCVIVPSVVWETFSIVAREAMACGVPVIASRLGALTEAVRDGENGLLFNAQATADLAAILQGLDADRSALTRLRLGIKPTDWITASERATRLEDVLAEVVAKGVGQSEMETADSELGVLRGVLTSSSS
jgi:glycosyltransferase involved in cell wall biosynthesis